jgi:hypothetical protein
MRNPSVAMFVIVGLSLVGGILGLLLVCFGSIAIPASIYAGEDINFLGQNDPGTAMFYGITAFFLGLLLVAIPVFLIYFIFRQRSDNPVIDQYHPYQSDLE